MEKQSSSQERRSETHITGLPARFRGVTLKNFEYSESRVPKEYGQACYNFAKGKYRENCLLLCGAVGNGKSHLAIATLKNIEARRTGRVLFMLADEMFTELNYAATNYENKARLIKHYLTDFDCLCIDGLEKDRFTDAVRENLYMIINKAYFEASRIIITTNLSMDAFRDLDERIFSRLNEMSIILPFSWDDYRLKK
ncbi:MAG TPA: ATP-binding protein [Ignavibacteriales bacterium]|nr:ATP-binding protein [Ignavibacteriales bacterium]